MKWALSLCLLLSPLASAEERSFRLDGGETVRYEIVASGGRSARPTADRLMRHLVAGEIDQAARLSNAPKRRLQILRSFRESVGEAEFKRVFADYSGPQSRFVAEIAMGRHRVLVWQLGTSAETYAGQYYVEAASGFLMDDEPSEARSRLQRLLGAYRAGKVSF